MNQHVYTLEKIDSDGYNSESHIVGVYTTFELAKATIPEGYPELINPVMGDPFMWTTWIVDDHRHDSGYLIMRRELDKRLQEETKQ